MDLGVEDSEGRGDACEDIEARSIEGKDRGCGFKKKRPNKYWAPSQAF